METNYDISDIIKSAEEKTKESSKNVEQYPDVFVNATEEQKQIAAERRKLLQAEQNTNITPADFILPVCSILIVIIALILCMKQKRIKQHTEIPEEEKKMVLNKAKNKRILKNIIIGIWIVYIILQFFFFVPFKTFDRSYDLHYNTTYYYTGRIIKPLWYDKAYTQIDFPLLLTQAGVVTIVMGTLYFTLSPKAKTTDKE